MPELDSYDYAVIRVVPDLERGEFINAGILLFAKTAGVLLARVWLDAPRLSAMAPDRDTATIEEHLASFERIAAGGADAGPIGELSPSQRFHWLAAPRSTMIQISPIHSGLCRDPAAEVQRLFERLVRPTDPAGAAAKPE